VALAGRSGPLVAPTHAVLQGPAKVDELWAQPCLVGLRIEMKVVGDVRYGLPGGVSAAGGCRVASQECPKKGL
jgi:hypothetical protein